MKAKRERVRVPLQIGTAEAPREVTVAVFEPLPADRRQINDHRMDAMARALEKGMETIPWKWLGEAGDAAAELLGLQESDLEGLSVTESRLVTVALARWATEPDQGN